MWREYHGHAPAVALIMPVNTGRGLVFRPFQLARMQMPPTPLKARARGLRTLAIAWVRGVLGCNDFSAGATKHAWRTSPSPWPPSSPLGERKGEGFPAPFLAPLSAPPRRAEGGRVPRSCPRTPVCSATGRGRGMGSPPLSPHPCLLRHGERQGERGVRERTNVSTPPRNGRTDPVRAR